MRPDDTIQDLEKLHGESFSWSLVCCRGDRAEAEEVLQTTYLKVLDGRARRDREGAIKPWLFAVIRRTAAGRRRQTAVRNVLLGRWMRPEPTTAAHTRQPDPEEEMLRSEEGERVRGALAALAARQRQALELVFFHQLTVRQASAVMGVSLGTARTHYHRGKQALLRELAGEIAS